MPKMTAAKPHEMLPPCAKPEEGAACINLWLPAAARHARWLGYSPEEACKLIRSVMTRPEKKSDEVSRAVALVYGTEPTAAAPREPEVKYDSAQLAEYAQRLTEEEVNDLPAWLQGHSPVNVDITPAEFLEVVFPDEIAFATTNMHANGGFIFESADQRDEVNRYAAGNRPYKSGNDSFCGCWYLSNPIDGEWRDNGRGGLTCRSEVNLTSFAHLVLESDVAPADLWLAMLVQEALPIVALYTSGNRSVHALCRIAARTKTEFERFKCDYIKRFVPLGADRGAMTAVRPTRLPGVTRYDNKQVQRLLWLNPRPIARAIWRPTES